MSIWSEIKHALNSTLGTSEFKPLDKLIRFEGKRLAVSDTTFLKIPKGSFTKDTYFVEDICTLTPSVGGSVRVSANMTLMSWTTEANTYGRILVYVNGVNKYTFSQSHSFYVGNTNKDVVVSGDFNFDANDVIELKVQGMYGSSTTANNGRITFSSMQLNAIVVDNLMGVSV